MHRSCVITDVSKCVLRGLSVPRGTMSLTSIDVPNMESDPAETRTMVDKTHLTFYNSTIVPSEFFLQMRRKI